MTSDLDALRDALLRWYARERRDLPWRRTRDPTRSSSARSCSSRPRSRGSCRATWSGSSAGRRRGARGRVARRRPVRLGRARLQPARARAHAAARQSPATAGRTTCATLPGVGPYTAAAVASFAFGAQVAAVDTNARRVAGRLGRGAPDALRPARPRGRLEPGRDGARRDRLHGAGVARCDACPVAAWCASAGRPAARRRRAPGAARASASRTRTAGSAAGSSRRWRRARGCRRTSPRSVLERALAGLVRDGLVRRVDGGFSLG